MADELDLDVDEFMKKKKPKVAPIVPTATPSNDVTLNQADLEDALRKAGWDEKMIPTMSAYGMAEGARADRNGEPRIKMNSYNPGVGPGGKKTIEESIGPWQINMHPSLKRNYDRNLLATDPVYNAKAALDIYKQQGLDAWRTTRKTGTYKKFLKNRPLISSTGASVPSISPNGSTTSAPDVDDVDAFMMSKAQDAPSIVPPS